MNRRLNTIERAFELARTSGLANVEDIRKTLKAEGYADWQEQLSGRSIRTQLRALIAAKLKTQSPRKQ